MNASIIDDEIVVVRMGRAEVEAFAARWPCSGLKGGATLWIELYRKGGDIRRGRVPTKEGECRAEMVRQCREYAQSRGLLTIGR